MLEWLKRHAWKACKRQKRFGGSNPPLSAGEVGMRTQGFVTACAFAERIPLSPQDYNSGIGDGKRVTKL